MINELERSVKAYHDMLDTAYHFIIGRKNQTININLYFDKKECFHVLGLQYLTDIPQLNSDRGKVFEKLYDDSSFRELIVNSDKYKKIAERIAAFSDIEAFLDSNDTVFKFNPRANSYSLIQADYILKNSDSLRNIYLFISENTTSELSDVFYCRSFFPRSKTERDYVIGHTSFKLLYKEKENLRSGEKKQLYIAPSYEKQLNIQKANTSDICAEKLPPKAYISRDTLKKNARELTEKRRKEPAHSAPSKKHDNSLE